MIKVTDVQEPSVLFRRLFAKSGYRVAVLARNADKLKALSESIKSDGGEVRTAPMNESRFDPH